MSNCPRGWRSTRALFIVQRLGLTSQIDCCSLINSFSSVPCCRALSPITSQMASATFTCTTRRLKAEEAVVLHVLTAPSPRAGDWSGALRVPLTGQELPGTGNVVAAFTTWRSSAVPLPPGATIRYRCALLGAGPLQSGVRVNPSFVARLGLASALAALTATRLSGLLAHRCKRAASAPWRSCQRWVAPQPVGCSRRTCVVRCPSALARAAAAGDGRG
jgi:hypothetical protein